jgi:predicted dehydrogenase
MEKPCSHNVFEGRKLVEAARKYDRIVQHGTQSRSDPAWIASLNAIRSGRYGKLLVAYGWASKPRRSIGFRWPKTPPAELNYDLWLGPAPQQPYHENLVHYNWHWFWDFGNGEIGNQGVHQMDIARWAMPDGATPKSILSLGGRYGYVPQDQGQTPNVQLTVIDFGGPKIIFEVCGLVEAMTAKVSNEFLTDEGVIKNGKFYPKGKTKGLPLEGADGAGENQVDLSGRPLKELRGKDPARLHMANFIDCVRNRRRQELRAEIAEGHASSMLSHLANLSYRLGKEVSHKNAKKALESDQHLSDSFKGLSTHLAGATGLDLDKIAVRMGKHLAFDAAAERFIDDAEADALLTRPYRAPYAVPEQV